MNSLRVFVLRLTDDGWNLQLHTGQHHLMIVSAETPTLARQLAAASRDGQTTGLDPTYWLDPELSTCDDISAPEQQGAVLLYQYDLVPLRF